MNYPILSTELRQPQYAGKSDADAAAMLNAATETQVVTRFASYRTLAGLLSDQEYATAKQTLAVVAAQNPRVADAVKMLELPGDEQGHGGGLDFSEPTVRLLVHTLFGTPELAAIRDKLLAIAERKVSRAQQLGLPPVHANHVASSRTMTQI